VPTKISYYPSARVRLLIRLEDYGAPGTPKPPKRPVVNRRGVKDSGSSDVRVVQSGSVFELVGPGGQPGQLGGPHDQTTSSDGLTHVVDGIIPLDAQHDRNGIRIADTLKLNLFYVDLPIDPRVIRAIGVQYFDGTISSGDWERGERGELRESATAQGLALPYNVVPDSFIDKAGLFRTNLRFEGWCDELGMGLPRDGMATLSLDCTDNTRLLIEIDAPPALTLDPNIRIDQAIANYLAAFPQLRGFSVEYRPAVDASKIPVLKDALSRGAYPPKLGPAPGGSSKLTLWDYLTDVAGAIGHTIRVSFSRIIIQRAKTLYVAGFTSRPDDPFQGRSFPDGQVIRNRTYVYGDNMLEFEMRRRFTKAQATNVEVRSYLPQRKKTIVVRYPEKADRQTRHMPGENSDQKYTVVRVSGIGDPASLRVVAQTAYESLGRNEVEATIVSRNLSSLGGEDIDPDILDAEPGDSIDAITAPTGDEQDFNTIQALASESSVAQRLTNAGFDPAFASAYAKAYSNQGFPRTFRARTISTKWDNGDGLEIQIGCINYIEVRVDADLPPGEEISPEESNLSPEPAAITVEDSPQ
jgi:hypothetical protein